MKRRSFFFLYLLCSMSTVAQQEQASSLPPEMAIHMQELQELQQKNRYVEAIAKLDDLDVRYPNNAALCNARGSIYMSPALRDFAKAEEMFDKALKLAPKELPPHFNKAELLFVKHDWAAASKAFQQVLQDFPKLPLQVRHLVYFKHLVSEVKQDQVSTAEKILNDHFTFMDDTPAYYFSKAAIAFHKKDETSAKDWISRANGIFKGPETSAYIDTLMEVRWVPNIGLPEAPKSE
jgi:tetratricopeptide (TPR) repeat protein